MYDNRFYPKVYESINHGFWTGSGIKFLPWTRSHIQSEKSFFVLIVIFLLHHWADLAWQVIVATCSVQLCLTTDFIFFLSPYTISSDSVELAILKAVSQSIWDWFMYSIELIHLILLAIGLPCNHSGQPRAMTITFVVLEYW